MEGKKVVRSLGRAELVRDPRTDGRDGVFAEVPRKAGFLLAWLSYHRVQISGRMPSASLSLP